MRRFELDSMAHSRLGVAHGVLAAVTPEQERSARRHDANARESATAEFALGTGR